ncbi:MAG: LysR family transcriptional regulator [Erysipelotrichaceae bacterium]|nr:LysR family transcriptional regulator [Erysipelotrichaceae bacterium]
MNNSQIRIFNTIVETNSFNRAAVALGIDYNKVKYQMDQLERELKTVLFLRNHKGCQLTDDGIVFYNYSLQLVEQYYEMLDNIGQLHKISIGIDMSCHPDSLMEATKDICSQKKLECVFVDYDAEYLLAALERGEVDCIFNYEFDVPKIVDSFVLMEDHMVVVMSQKSPLYNKEKIDYSDLLKTKIYFKYHDLRGSRKMTKILESISADYMVYFGISESTVKKAMNDGEGVMIVPYNFWRHYLNGYECRDFLKTIMIPYRIYSYQRKTSLNSIIKSISEHFRNHYKP